MYTTHRKRNPPKPCPSSTSVCYLPARKKQSLEKSMSNEEAPSTISGDCEVLLSSAGRPLGGSQDCEPVSDASHWFDEANLNPKFTEQEPSYYNDEPPFFIANHAPSSRYDFTDTRAVPTGPFGRLVRDDSENEDLRAVIDDLTIENKLLSKLLKSHRGNLSPCLPRDALFELRIHDLTSHKKRELEALLQSFISTLEVPSKSKSSLVPTRSTATERNEAFGSRVNVHSAIKRRHPDSAYASMSTSGYASLTPSKRDGLSSVSLRGTKDKSIKSFLQNIPHVNIPKDSTVMSEQMKKELVVQRLEQLYTGKSSEPGGHGQALQQQAVSRSAANADRLRNPTSNIVHGTEGSRESQILSIPSNCSPGAPKKRAMPPRSSRHKSQPTYDSRHETDGKLNEDSNSDLSVSSQRPTRPLDLDIHRAQIGADNIEYIRHLELRSPSLGKEPVGRVEGWVYFNLLMSMAQLHTMNVTPEFTRTAIKSLSTKLELSEDGSKIRWTGSMRGSNISDQTRNSCTASNPPTTAKMGSRSEKSPTFPPPRVDESVSPSDVRTTGSRTDQLTRQSHLPPLPDSDLSCHPEQPQSGSTFTHYSPFFAKTNKSVSSQESDSENDVKELSGSAGDNAGQATSDPLPALNTSRTNSVPVERKSLVFYSNPLFCSDLSGDQDLAHGQLATSSVSDGTLGIPSSNQPWQDDLRDYASCYFTMRKTAANPDLIEERLHPLVLENLGQSRATTKQPLELAASGIGGITPQDNFAVDVHFKRQLNYDSRSRLTKRTRASGRHGGGVFDYQMVKVSVTKLSPSRLPPPSYTFPWMGSSSSSEADESIDPSDEELPNMDSILVEYSRSSAFLNRFSSDDSNSDELKG